MSGMRTVLSSTALLAAMGLGYGMWSIIAPGEERRREMLKNLPESNPQRMEETRLRNAMVMQVLKEAAETDQNLAAEAHLGLRWSYRIANWLVQPPRSCENAAL